MSDSTDVDASVSGPRPAASRRTVLGGGIAAAIAVTAGGAAPRAAADDRPLRAAVSEFRDQWTGAIGLATLLEDAGVEVIELPADTPPTELGVDLIAFGTFTNNDARYDAYADAHGAALASFVATGGVVLDLAQSDQFGPVNPFLPSGMRVVIDDTDYDTVYPVAADHPLIAALPVSEGRVFTGRNATIRVSWETVADWEGLRVLLACAPVGVRPPCLLEGAHGKGRFLISSLTVDKLYSATGQPVQPAAAVADSRAFFAAVADYVMLVRDGRAPEVVPTPPDLETVAGPLIGDVTAGSVRLWLRPASDQRHHTRWRASVVGAGRRSAVATADLDAERDHTVLFDVTGLQADTSYQVEITPVDDPGTEPLTASFTTAPLDHRPARVVMGMGSCAPSTPDDVWTRIMDEGCDSFVMLGDTPYIDSGDLAVARRKHREFLQVPQLARLISSMPVWGTWDDHDFGGNDVHGDFAGKQNTRTAFVDHRANATFGHDDEGRLLTRPADGQGVYTSLRRGPIEVILLDPRWFSRTEPSWADPSRPTCLGRVQWEWLQRTLLRSTATFKILATGMIWDDKQNSEADDWGTYVHERDAMFSFIARHEIPGVVLVGGDIHVSRALDYGPVVGYDLWQFIVSPLHDRTIPSLNVPNPALVHSAVEPNVFCRLVADTTVSPATLTATWINREGEELFEVHRTSTQLGHRR